MFSTIKSLHICVTSSKSQLSCSLWLHLLNSMLLLTPWTQNYWIHFGFCWKLKIPFCSLLTLKCLPTMFSLVNSQNLGQHNTCHFAKNLGVRKAVPVVPFIARYVFIFCRISDVVGLEASLLILNSVWSFQNWWINLASSCCLYPVHSMVHGKINFSISISHDLLFAC